MHHMNTWLGQNKYIGTKINIWTYVYKENVVTKGPWIISGYISFLDLSDI